MTNISDGRLFVLLQRKLLTRRLFRTRCSMSQYHR